MPSYVPAKRATAYVTYVALIDSASGKLFVTNPTLAAGDVKISIDGGALANPATLPVVTPAGSKLVKVSLSAAEMTGDTIAILFSDVAGAEWNDLLEVVDTSVRQIDDLLPTSTYVTPPTAAVMADAVWDEAISGHLTAGSTGAALNAAGSSGDPWATVLPGAYGAGTAGNIIGTRVDVAVSTRLAPTVTGRTLDVTTTGEAGLDWGNIGAPTTTQTLSGTTISPSQVVASVTGSVGSVTGSVGSVTGSVGSVTGSVGSVTGAVGSVTGSVGSVAANGITAASLDPTAGAEIADAVWDEAIAGHVSAGSTGAALNAAGAAGDPWATPLPGVYGAGTAGNIVGGNLDATISSRATQASVNTLTGFVDTEVAAILAAVVPGVADIKAKTDNLPPDPADNSAILAAIAAVPAAPSAVVIADTLLNRDMSAVSDTNPRSPLNALRRLRNKNDAAVTPGSIVIYKENDTTIAYVATLTTDVAAAPVTVFDPTT